jgi:hypothetical protein
MAWVIAEGLARREPQARHLRPPKHPPFEALGGVRVHFSPFQAKPAVRKSDEPLEGVVTSSDGYLADKDRGHVLRDPARPGQLMFVA